ncbi:hypothetical protein [Pelagicoccus sp. SDUM812005]|uniref:hypothetical protein n=1 Tax=Pelagicoccus sp. SDUM812005 TaxID=3041257 RepID=UPI00280FD0B8|nr:hypothetical protein [Pelagicoccus sp. SDUM812005]MDQ8180500.1 hypothetical protein [Pelagicoccus sp. SDUM812005]
MSLINQALKLEQQKRHTETTPVAPMVTRMAQRRSRDKMPLLLFGFTGMGMLLAASVTAIFYFGSEFLESDKALATTTLPPAASSEAPQDASSPAAPADAEPQIEELLGQLSPDQLSTVQQMLLERDSEQPDGEAVATNETAPADQSESPSHSLSDLSRLQAIVDSYSVQGIRKAGAETRVFLNGRIRKIGDVIDIENRLQLIGFTETALIFRDSSGQRFEKAL